MAHSIPFLHTTHPPDHSVTRPLSIMQSCAQCMLHLPQCIGPTCHVHTCSARIWEGPALLSTYVVFGCLALLDEGYFMFSLT
eukprot:6362074-Pyramimonas_sp.AAC.1